MSFGTLIVVLIASTPGAGGSLTFSSTPIASGDDTAIVPGLKEPIATDEAAGMPCEDPDKAPGPGGGARVVATMGGALRFGAARTRDGRR